MRRKLENSRFEIWYSVLAPSGGVEKNLNMGAQLHIIPYKKTPKHFLELHGLIDFRCAQTLALPCAFGIVPPVRTWQFFVAPCNELAKYFYMGAHLQYTCMGYKAMVEVFFQITSRWSKWCAQTLHPFSQILKIFQRIRASIVAPPSENFENWSIPWKGIFFHEKNGVNTI